MARPKAEEHRGVEVLLRLTDRQATILDAMVALDMALELSTRAQIAYEAVSRALDEALQNELIQAQLELHARRAAQETSKVTPIKRGGPKT